jgi:hypothetical protein
MRTLSKQAIISRDNHRVEFDLPADLPEGRYQVLLVIEEEPQPQAAGGFDFPINTTLCHEPLETYSREKMYGDEGR